MSEKIEISAVLPKDMDVAELMRRLKTRIYETSGSMNAFERGQQIREFFPEEADAVIKLADEAMAGLLVLPGTGPELHFVGNPPKWSGNPVNNKEYTFHLNRMHHWKTLSEAYSLTGDLRYAKKVIEEMEDWMEVNPCPSIKDDEGSYRLSDFEGLGIWRALEIGIRGYRTWPIVTELLIDTPYFNESFLERLVCCVFVHCKALYEISPLLWPKADHNHYLMENLGLMSFSCLFPEMRDSGKFLEHAGRELDRCMKAQCTPCGGQIEGCPSYHNGCVFWFAMRRVFAEKYHVSVPEEYTAQLEKMFRHSVHATRACGGNFPWGDSHTAYKETMSLAAVSVYMAYGDLKYLETALFFYPLDTVMADIRDNLWRIGDIERLKKDIETAADNGKKPVLPLLAWQKDLNQVYLRSGWEREALSLMTACRTPVQNLHAHIDAGGFDFTAFGEPLVSDPGIYTYRDDENRKRFKGALWHNCLTVNRKNMWEYQGSWAYGPQKEGAVVAVSEEEGMVSIVSRHQNYAPAVATRVLAMIDRKFLLVLDMVTGLTAGDTVQVNFHLNRTELVEQNHGVMTVREDHPNIELTAVPDYTAIEIEAAKISTQSDVWHDSKIVRFESAVESGDVFFHAALIVPHDCNDKKQHVKKICAKSKDEEIWIEAVVDEKEYYLKFYRDRLTMEGERG